jgi:hypothetical protein
MDGTISGDGPGPRAMRLRVTNLMLASRDQVAIDATAAKLMGFDPLTIRFIRLAHEAGLGKGDPREIDLVGDDVSDVNLRYSRNENTFASKGQKLIYHGPLKPLEGLLLRSPLVPWSFAASRLYHDGYWYPFVGKGRKRTIMETEWVGSSRYEAEGAGIIDARAWPRIGAGLSMAKGGGDRYEIRVHHRARPRAVRSRFRFRRAIGDAARPVRHGP